MPTRANGNYVVDKVGIQDPPEAQYFVLDLVHSWSDREVLALLGNKHRQQGREQRAQECFDALDASNAAHGAYMETRNELYKKQQKRRR